MYGGGLGMGSMGGMYGGGLGMGSMGGMYGGGLGMGSMGGMYGGGLGMGSTGGMYGGSSMGSMGGMYGGSTLNSGMSGGLGNGMQGFNSITNDPSGSSNALIAQPGQPGQLGPPGVVGSPTDPTSAGAGVPGVCGAPPPLHETPRERAKRLRDERRRERDILVQQKQKREQLRFQARMEMAGHFTNVLVQSLRSVVEFCTVCFGTYYSMKTFRQMASMPQMSYQRGPNGMMVPVQQAAQVTGGTASTAVAKGGKGWKSWIIFGVLFVIVELAYTVLSRRRSAAAEQHQVVELTDSEEEWLLSDAEEEGSAADNSRGVYVALHDYQSSNGDQFLTFKAGDRFLVDNFAEGSWCVARPVEEDGRAEPSNTIAGYVPSNYLRHVENLTKL
eukprot:gene4107-2953_t